MSWGPSDVLTNTAKSISFTVLVDKATEGTSITNTAQLTAANADPVSNIVTLEVRIPARSYFPLVRR